MEVLKIVMDNRQQLNKIIVVIIVFLTSCNSRQNSVYFNGIYTSISKYKIASHRYYRFYPDKTAQVMATSANIDSVSKWLNKNDKYSTLGPYTINKDSIYFKNPVEYLKDSVIHTGKDTVDCYGYFVNNKKIRFKIVPRNKALIGGYEVVKYKKVKFY